MVHEYKLERRIEFADTDMAGIVHFSNFFRFMEATEHAFFNSLGLLLHGQRDGAMFGWVRVNARADYLRPVHYLDRLETHLTVRGKSRSSLSYSFVFRVVGTDDPEAEVKALEEPLEVARGSMKVVYVSKPPGADRIRSLPMPERVERVVSVSPGAKIESNTESNAESNGAN